MHGDVGSKAADHGATLWQLVGAKAGGRVCDDRFLKGGPVQCGGLLGVAAMNRSSVGSLDVFGQIGGGWFGGRLAPHRQSRPYVTEGAHWQLRLRSRGRVGFVGTCNGHP